LLKNQALNEYVESAHGRLTFFIRFYSKWEGTILTAFGQGAAQSHDMA